MRKNTPTSFLVAALFSLAPTLGWSQNALRVEILERGPHHRVERVLQPVEQQNSSPRTPRLSETNRYSTYTVLETGMNYYSEEEKTWKLSEEVIEIIDGVGIARRGQQKVIFSPNLNAEGSIDLLAPDGKRLRGTVLALVYFDTLSGAQVTLGTVKDSLGKVVAPNQILYEDAFDNIKADVLYTWRKSGLEQDVILRERPPAPEALGMENISTRLQVMTEFFAPPEPQKRQQILRAVEDPQLREAMVEPDFVDEELDFGAIRMSQGRAFYLPDALGKRPERHQDSVVVGKQWFKQDGRTILLESVEFEAVEPHLQNLPEAGRQQAWLEQKEKNDTLLAAQSASRMKERTLPPKLNARVGTEKEERVWFAQADLKPKPGFVLDYETMSNQSNFTFRGDRTYYIDGTVYLSGTTTLEGGAVIKHRPRATSSESDPRLFVQGPFVCNTSPYRPAIITAKDDNTVGATISGSDGDPSNPNKFAYYGIYFYFSQNAVTLKHVRISHAYWGVLFNDNLAYTHTLRHLQFVDCTTPIYSQKGSGGNTVLKAQNILIDGANQAFYTWYCDVVGEHLTINDASSLYYNIGGSSYSLKNSLLVNIDTIQTYTRNSEADNKNNPAGTIFQSVGAGNFYLANGSPYRNAGITSIDTALLADLGSRTTYPPNQLTGTATADVVLSPVIGRDTDTPDIGYHYPAVDYALENYTVSGTDITITPGTVLIAVDDVGLLLKNGAMLKSQGIAEAPIHFMPYYLIQEQSDDLYTGVTINAILIKPDDTGTLPDALITWTHFHDAADGGYSLSTFYFDDRYNDLTIKNSEFHGGVVTMSAQSGNSLILINNLFNRANLRFIGYHQVTAKNNLFYKSTVQFSNYSSFGNWTWHYNVFDQTVLSESSRSTSNGYNGYVGSNPDQLLSSSGGDTVVSSFNYATGPFGDFYQSSTDFVNDGNVTSASLELAHFTTSSVHTSKDTGNVDLGYHLPAVTSAGAAYDDDGDFLPDYFEDADGDSTYDAGTETDWQDDDTDGDELTDFAEIAGGNFGEADYVDLPGVGANALHKDVFVEADYYMNYGPSSVSLEPYTNSLAAVVAAFANAPVTNPDGIAGINLYFDVSDGIDATQYSASQLDLSPDHITETTYFRTRYLTPGREDYFHWSLFAHKYAASGSGGVSLAIPSDTFVIAMGQFGTNRTEHFESLIIMHELGHNLGLDHGGTNNVSFKANYLSIMNPNYCVSDRSLGLKVNGETNVLDFSRLEIAAVDERALNEMSGFSPATNSTTEAELEAYGIFVYGKGWIETTNGASARLDFNNDETIQSGQLDYLTTNTDLNGDGDGNPASEEDDSFPASWNDWENLDFDGGQIGEGFEALSARAGIECLIY